MHIESAAGYLTVGLLAFALGVAVTVFCTRLHGRARRRDNAERHDD